MTISRRKKGSKLWNFIKDNWLLGLMIGMGVLLIAGGIAATIVGAAAYGAPAAFGIISIIAGLSIIGATVGYTIYRYQKRRKIEKWTKGKLENLDDNFTQLNADNNSSFQVTAKLRKNSSLENSHHSQKNISADQSSINREVPKKIGISQNMKNIIGNFFIRKRKKEKQEIENYSTDQLNHKKNN